MWLIDVASFRNLAGSEDQTEPGRIQLPLHPLCFTFPSAL